MAIFYSSQNNGVIAVISEEDARLWKKVTDAGGDPTLVGVKIFTFYTPNEHSREFLGTYRMYTGTVKLLEYLGRVHEIKSNDSTDSGWNGYVPFSNGGYVAEHDEKRYLTTVEDVIEKFDLQLPHTNKTTRSVRGS